ncbi:hypothetical protein EYR38_002580 [Pleurotus pulmonarius]|nr:hypothetical protein EYR38_002580 [Pleurotus pulmonarius]
MAEVFGISLTMPAVLNSAWTILRGAFGDDHHALLTDFGLSLMLDDVRSRSTATHAGSSRGTLRWMAPECLNGHRANEASDVYSLGMTIWEVYSEELPLATFFERVIAFQIETKQLRPERPQRLAEDGIWELIQRCWAHDPSRRPKVEDVRHALKSYTSYALPEESAPPLTSFFSESYRGSSETNVDPTFAEMPVTTRRGEDTVSSAWTVLTEPSQRTATTLSTNLQILAQPWSQTEWSDSLYSNPPKWQRGNPDIYIDSIIFPMVPSNKTYKYRIIKGSEDLGIRPTYTLNKDESQTVNFLDYTGGYGIRETMPIKVIAVDPEGNEVLVATSEWAHSLRSEPPRWRHGDSKHSIESVMFPRNPTQKSYSFRVVKGKEDLGVRPSPTSDDGTLMIDLVDYNGGQGIQESTSIRVFAVDSEGNEELVATWDITAGTTSTAAGPAAESAWRLLSPGPPHHSQRPIPQQQVALSSSIPPNPSETPRRSLSHPSPEVVIEGRQPPDPSARNPKRRGWVARFFKS